VDCKGAATARKAVAPTEEVSLKMRKVLALALVAGLAVSSAFVLTGCAKKESSETTSEQTQPMETQTDTSATMDTTAHDSM
jgi:hypothetical protein